RRPGRAAPRPGVAPLGELSPSVAPSASPVDRGRGRPGPVPRRDPSRQAPAVVNME
ncbi:hypothetical protein HMPREF0731_4341, partial [Pseudoroseomonas cervicalis ATCC 49957]